MVDDDNGVFSRKLGTSQSLIAVHLVSSNFHLLCTCPRHENTYWIYILHVWVSKNNRYLPEHVKFYKYNEIAILWLLSSIFMATSS